MRDPLTLGEKIEGWMGTCSEVQCDILEGDGESVRATLEACGKARPLSDINWPDQPWPRDENWDEGDALQAYMKKCGDCWAIIKAMYEVLDTGSLASTDEETKAKTQEKLYGDLQSLDLCVQDLIETDHARHLEVQYGEVPLANREVFHATTRWEAAIHSARSDTEDSRGVGLSVVRLRHGLARGGDAFEGGWELGVEWQPLDFEVIVGREEFEQMRAGELMLDATDPLEREHGIESCYKAVEKVQEYLRRADVNAAAGIGAKAPGTAPTRPLSSRKVFVVHGHDTGLKEEVARFLEKLGCRPIILHQEADEGRTLIQKFEDNSDVAYSVVLLTSDDVGFQRGRDSEAKARARQNVVLELGFFMGRLDRRRVRAVVKGDLEHPSDTAGVLYTQYDERGAWRAELAREMKAAGMDIDMNKAI